LNRGFIYEL